MTRIPKTLITSALLLCAATILMAEEKKDAVYVSRELGFSIQYPADWEGKENTSGAALAISAPSESKDFRNNITVIVHDLPKAASLNEFADAQITGIDKMLDGYVRDEKTSIDFGKLKAIRVVFRYAQKDVRVKCLCILAVNNERGYIITCSADAAKFDATKKQFDKILESFKTL